MVRLMLVVAPIACVLAGITVSQTYFNFIGEASEVLHGPGKKKVLSHRQAKKVQHASKGFEFLDSKRGYIAAAVVTVLTLMLSSYVYHCTWVRR